MRGAEVEILPVYQAVRPAAAGPALLRLFGAEGVDMITFTSSSTVANFVRAFPDDKLPAMLGDAEIACMGPVTADTARNEPADQRRVAESSPPCRVLQSSPFVINP